MQIIHCRAKNVDKKKISNKELLGSIFHHIGNLHFDDTEGVRRMDEGKQLSVEGNKCRGFYSLFRTPQWMEFNVQVI